ncbi:MAG TPA: HdeA/HdeB family chaperone [Xanthobacteraceae bacterium]
MSSAISQRDSAVTRLRGTAVGKVVLSLAFAAGICRAIAQTEITVDVSRVTCAEFLAMHPDELRVVSAWMSGYLNQKHGRAWIDFSVHERNIVAVKQWCASNPDQLVMKGLEDASVKLQK